MERLVGDKLRLSPGSGQTAYNICFPTGSGDAIAIGVYEDGRVWSDFKGLGEEISG